MTILASERPEFSTSQHCRSDECAYTFSHTAEWCGHDQQEFCECPFDYAEGWAARANAELRGEVVHEIPFETEEPDVNKKFRSQRIKASALGPEVIGEIVQDAVPGAVTTLHRITGIKHSPMGVFVYGTSERLTYRPSEMVEILFAE